MNLATKVVGSAKDGEATLYACLNDMIRANSLQKCETSLKKVSIFNSLETHSLTMRSRTGTTVQDTHVDPVCDAHDRHSTGIEIDVGISRGNEEAGTGKYMLTKAYTLRTDHLHEGLEIVVDIVINQLRILGLCRNGKVGGGQGAMENFSTKG